MFPAQAMITDSLSTITLPSPEHISKGLLHTVAWLPCVVYGNKTCIHVNGMVLFSVAATSTSIGWSYNSPRELISLSIVE